MRSLKGALLALLVFAGAPAAVAAGSARATLPPGTLSTRPVVTRSAPSALPDTWSNLFTDDFEGAFPGPWQIVSNGTFNQASWGRWTCWSGDSPTHSVGSAAGGTAAIACNDPYPGNLNTWLVYGPFSLANGYSAAELRFRFKLECEEPGAEVYDYFNVMASANGTNFYGTSFAGVQAPQEYVFDLANVPDLGTLINDESVWIAFLFHSDGSVQLANGAQVDDVVLRVATAAAGDNTLALGVGYGAPGAAVTLALRLTNEVAVKGLQFDLVYDEDVANFTGVNVAGQGLGMAVSSHVVSAGRTRVVMYHDDSSVIAPGSFDIGSLTFEIVGQPPQTTAVTPTDIILSDAEGLPLGVAGQQGTITVTAVTQAPEVQIAVLKNPGRPRTLQILINVIRGSGNLPTVTAGGVPVTMSAQSGSRFLGTYAAANDAASVTITASDTNTQGPGSNQVTITFWSSSKSTF